MDGACIDQAAVCQDVPYSHLGVFHQQVGGDEVVAVAVGRVLLGAQDAGGLLTCKHKQVLDALDEPGTLHHCRIAEFVDIIGSFNRDGMMLITSRVFWTTSQQFTRPRIVDTLHLHHLLKGIFVELGMEAAVGSTSYVHEASDLVVKQQLVEYVDWMVAVTDGEKLHAVIYIPTRATAAWKPR